ncbi:probable histone-lysine N-methyltransferase CG1716 isoform X1 [Bombus impatiens]|uniref:[histone H3]-lysine(36) N-trimethyltransferase n=2 Tax=Bombus impatiens TaxID=132113 RepID=A0A6P3DVR2_BOMIM|nr:probable histone-lysine N-methyltransferase CG1716 isoform X1 [Bombus impatiens]XP_024226381.1 probable histone-lysine N-methyltransferase CG1716 isoform X1 [Bombus impatiens]
MIRRIHGIKMARRRKSEMKSSVKTSLKYVPVRKSSRQIAKKQLEEKKINGDVLQISYSNDSEDSKSTTEYQTQVLPKKNQNSLRKHNKHKNISNSNVLAINEECSYSTTSQYKKDASESDSQDGIDIIVDQSNKLSPEDVQQVVVGNPNKEIVTESDSAEIEIWPEDVIEETVICEEMEVKEELKGSGCSLKQNDNVIVKEVLVVNTPSLETKNFVEYTVIQNENGMESMLIESDSRNTPTNDCYCNMQSDVCNLHKTGNSMPALCIDVPMTSNDRNNKSTNLEKSYTHSKDIINDQGDPYANKDAYIKKLQETLSKDDVFCKIDNKLADMQISEPSKEIQKLVNDLSNTENIMSPLQIAGNTEKVIPMSVDEESSSSILDKMEQLHQSNNSAILVDIVEKSITELNNDSCNDKVDCTNQHLLKSKVLSDKKNGNQRKTVHLQQVNEELYGDSEVDSKIDGEDTKLSSSSDNSNDTLLSMSNCKLTEFDTKCNNNSNDIDKKVEFRSRSGSTDTTGSESGSNSSGVRRSSRIRSIGLMKQRSRGRGLVMKPNVDIAKTSVQQEREKVANNVVSIAQEMKMDNISESQLDKETNISKTVNTFESLTLLATTCNTTGYDSDSSKPVKVKSRWRRSSELEMGGSNTGTVSTSAIGSVFGTIIANISESGSCSTIKTTSGSLTDINSSDSPSGSATITNFQSNTETEQTKEVSTSVNNNNIVQIPKTVGARILLPMVPEIKDREMEERLSQFEYLRENLYLTERYTNKETKRMVCDCFLTEEEIERGELGCGEDCLNRLLMIECGPRCVVGDRCTNKRFQNCEYAKCEVFRTEKKGFGLRAMVDLLAGEFIMEYVGEVVDPKDFRRRAKEYSKDKNKHYYFMALKSDQIIDATLKGNVSRFINHSCDPNSETQKWTVNGELRIGFFNKKFIAAGEEITFDYHFQRYGKEAQKCFCEAPNCRGWIGETPEEEKEKIEKKEKREKDMKKKKGEKKQADYMEDEDLEEEIDKLCSGGLKNRAHTLTLSRLMVRSRELEHRTRLLRLIQSGEQPCRRLFLDYHGLRLIWSYVMDISTNDSDEAQQFRLEVLKTLNTLPIPNKTMLMDSKIYNVVEKWSRRLYFSLSGDSPEDDQGKSKSNSDELPVNYDSNEKRNSYSLTDIEKQENNIEITDIKSDNTDQNLIPELALSLLAEWSNLKEVFRIPKKERIEQMKEHEREADRGYREELEKDEKRGTSYDRHRSDRYGRNEVEKRGDRRRGRESPESEHTRTKDKRIEERSSLVPIPRMTKYERRQLFALKVAKEEEERQRRQQQESWQDHETRCLALGIDPHTTAMVDPQTGYPVFYNPSIGQWQQYPTQDGEINQQCTSVYVAGPQAVSSHTQSGMVPQSSHVLAPSISSEISPGMSSNIPSGVPPVVYTLSQTPVYNQSTTAYSLLSHCHQQYPEGQLPLSNNLVSSGTSVPLQTESLYEHIEKQSDQQFSATFRQSQPEAPPIDLPPKWKSATDSRGRTYYYHVKERISQWLPPPPDHIGVQPDSSSTSESSEESSSSNEEDEEIDEDNNEESRNEELSLNNTLIEKSLNGSKHNVPKKSAVHNISGCSGLFPEGKKRREGLVQERIISPRREEDRMDHKTHKGIKEKLRRQKERAKFKEHVEKIRRHRRSNKSKSHSRHSLNKLQLPSSDLSTMSERKIKDTFRINMANVMVHFLNPYRKNDCKQGRITNTEDFKHLARKLTHFVLAKELKHCKSVDELQCNENVKHKAKDFVRKYMSKFGAVYQKSTDED